MQAPLTSPAAVAGVKPLTTRSVRRAVLLSAKKKKGPAGSFDLDALEAMEALYDGTSAADTVKTDGDLSGDNEGEELDKKAMKAKKKAEKIAAAAAAAAAEGSDVTSESEGKKNKKSKGGKDAKKEAKQKAKKGGKNKADDDDAGDSLSTEATAEPEMPAPQEVAAEVVDQESLSMEDRVRKARPKARMQIAESSQPGYVSMRLDDIAVVFRNQEVLKSANWEVSHGADQRIPSCCSFHVLHFTHSIKGFGKQYFTNFQAFT